MRTLLRTLIILAAALLVSGATYGLGQSGALTSLLPARGRPMQLPAQTQAGQTGAGDTAAQSGQSSAASPRAGGQLRGEPRGGMGLIGLFGVLRSLAVIAVAVVLVGLVGRLMGGRRGAATAGLESPM